MSLRVQEFSFVVNRLPRAIRRKRAAEGHDPRRAGEAMGVSSQAVRNWERGVMPLDRHIPAIAAYLDVTTDAVLDMMEEDDGEPDPESDEDRLERIIELVEDIRREVGDLRADNAALRSDFAQMAAEIDRIRGELS